MPKTVSHTVAVILLLLVFLTPTNRPAFADTSLEDAKKLLQKGLTIHEIDREVSRLTQQETGLSSQIDSNLKKTTELELKTAQSREYAGKILRSYYMGERSSLWLLLFHAKSFQDWMTVYDYLNIVMANDIRTLKQHQSSIRQLAELNTQLGQSRLELKKLKDAFLAQKERLVAMQQELDSELSAARNGAEIKQQISDLNSSWEQKGLPLFKGYLEAMSSAMKQLPDYLSSHQDSLKMDGFAYVLSIKDTELTDFLRSKDPLFNHVTYTFSKDKITLDAKQDGSSLQLTGHYLLEEKPENALRFVIDGLSYNGFQLPDTTIQALQEQIDLSIYPKQIASFLIATAVNIGQNVLNVDFSFDLSQ